MAQKLSVSYDEYDLSSNDETIIETVISINAKNLNEEEVSQSFFNEIRKVDYPVSNIVTVALDDGVINNEYVYCVFISKIETNEL